jgi:DNA-binding transcriptional LysR family regulator
MELRHLRYFVAVAEELHFGRAASRLHLAQPSLSRQVRDLERELGVPLLSRAHRRVALTTAGEAFLEGARLTLARAAEAAEEARRAHRGEVGRLRMGFVQSATFQALPRLLGTFRAAWPEVALELRAMTTLEQVAALRDRRIQLGLLRLPIDGRGIAMQVVSRDPLLVALPGDHRLAPSQRVPLAALAAEPFILYARSEGPGVRDAIVGVCLAAGFSPRVVQEASDTQTIVALVGAGLGISLLISPVPPAPDGAVVYRPLQEDLPPWELALAWRPDDQSAVLQRFLELTRGTRAGRPQLGLVPTAEA